MAVTTDQNLERLIEMLMGAFPDTLNTRDIAEALGVSQQTARNYIVRLHELEVPVEEPEEWRFTINPAHYAQPLRLTMAQAWFVYMLVRRVVRADLGRYALVNSVLKRLIASLHGSIAEQIDLSLTIQPTEWDRILQALVEGWHKERMVRIRYLALNASVPTTFTIAPWSFEPAVWTDSNYLVAGVHSKNGFEPYMLKLDRIQAATLLTDRFERPSLDALARRIDESWGIWGGETHTVTLRFSYRVKTRVVETRWHPSQQMKEHEDGSMLWTAQIAEARELMPWIRSWGADVEVLEPGWLRAEIAADAVRTARIYENSSVQPRRLF